MIILQMIYSKVAGEDQDDKIILTADEKKFISVSIQDSTYLLRYTPDLTKAHMLVMPSSWKADGRCVPVPEQKMFEKEISEGGRY